MTFAVDWALNNNYLSIIQIQKFNEKIKNTLLSVKIITIKTEILLLSHQKKGLKDDFEHFFQPLVTLEMGQLKVIKTGKSNKCKFKGGLHERKFQISLN